MINERKKTNKVGKREIFLCDDCDRDVDVYCECWIEGMDTPFKVEIIKNYNGSLHVTENIVLAKREKGKVIRFYSCCKCGSHINQPTDLDFIFALRGFYQLEQAKD